MKTILSVLCMLGMAVILTSCGSGGDGGSDGGPGNFAQASYTINGTTVTCYNVNSNVKTNDAYYVCTWYCAYYKGTGPSQVKLTFSEVTPCTEYEKDPVTGKDTTVCMTEGEPEFQLSNESYGATCGP